MSEFLLEAKGCDYRGARDKAFFALAFGFPEKEFEADSDYDFDNSLESYEDLDFDENWN